MCQAACNLRPALRVSLRQGCWRSLSAARAVSLHPNAPQIWNTETGEEMQVLEGHKNVVYAIAFNNPFGDRVSLL